MAFDLANLATSFLSSAAKAFGMTFGTPMPKTSAGGSSSGFITKGGVQGMAQAFLMSNQTKQKSFSEEMAGIKQANPSASSYFGRSTTPSVSSPNVSLVGVNNPKVTTALHNLIQRNNTDPNLERLIREMIAGGNTPPLTTRQGKLTNRG